MNKYKFKAKDINNKITRGVFYAKDPDDLRDIVSSMNYYLISYRKITESSSLFSFMEKIKVDDLTMFCRQFAIMVTAGIQIVNAIEILIDNTRNQKLKSILDVVHSDILKGQKLSDSFAKYPKTFPTFFRNMVAIGEISGKLDVILQRLADYYVKDARTQKKVTGALKYPLFLVAMAIGVLVLICVVVMPMFQGIFDQLGSDNLPAITKALQAFSNFLTTQYLYILAVLALIILLWVLLGRIEKVKRAKDKFKLTAPIISGVTIASATSRFTSGFSTLLSSSIPVVDAIGTMGKLMDNKILEERLAIVTSEIKRGQGISKSIETINTFPTMLTEMISIGEQTGQLEEVLDRVCSYYEEQVDTAIKQMTGMIEPVMIMVIAVIVVVIILAVFMPMLSLMTAVEQSGSTTY